jgi:uroporphyrinogen-III synthase
MSDTPTLIAPPSVLVTRPAADAQHWVAQLQAQGVQAQALPLITIAALADPQPLHHIAQRLDEFAAVMFVSANAVAYFFAQLPAAQQKRKQHSGGEKGKLK